MSDVPKTSERSTLQVAMGFLLGILVCVSCWFLSFLLGAALGLRHAWMFPVLNAAALAASGVVALRNVSKSSYPEGVLIAVSVAFILNVLVFAISLSGHAE